MYVQVPALAAAELTSELEVSGIKNKRMKLLRRIEACTRGIRQILRQAWVSPAQELRTADEMVLAEMRRNLVVA